MTNDELKQALKDKSSVKVKGLTGTYGVEALRYKAKGNIIKCSVELYDGKNCVLYASPNDIEKE